jgi:hypothetical protein
MLAAIDWNNVLLYGVPAYIAAVGGAVAAIISSLNRQSLKTANGRTLAQTVEETKAAVVAGTATVNKISDMQDNLAPPAGQQA